MRATMKSWALFWLLCEASSVLSTSTVGFRCETRTPVYTNLSISAKLGEGNGPFLFDVARAANSSSFTVGIANGSSEENLDEICGIYFGMRLGASMVGNWTATPGLKSYNNCSEPGMVVLGDSLNKRLAVLALNPTEMALARNATVTLMATVASTNGSYWSVTQETPGWLTSAAPLEPSEEGAGSGACRSVPNWLSSIVTLCLTLAVLISS